MKEWIERLKKSSGLIFGLLAVSGLLWCVPQIKACEKADKIKREARGAYECEQACLAIGSHMYMRLGYDVCTCKDDNGCKVVFSKLGSQNQKVTALKCEVK